MSGTPTAKHDEIINNSFGKLRGAGEDITNDVVKGEQRFSYSSLAAAATLTVVKGSAGFVHSVFIGSISCPTLTLYDNTAGSGTIVRVWTAGAPISTYLVDEVFATGITIVSAAGMTPFVDIGYR